MRFTTLEKRLFSRNLYTTVSIWVAFCAIATPPSYAADPSAPQQGAIDEVVVTSRLRQETASQAPVVVQALSGDQLEQQGISNMQALAAAIPNVNMSTNYLDDAIYIRGVGNTGSNIGFEQPAGLFIDGVYYGNGHWINGAYVDLDTAEIMEGPQGVYFGKNTIAGAFNIHTKMPSAGFDSSVKIGYEAVAQEKYVEGMLSVPLTDTLAIRVVTRDSTSIGWARSMQAGTSEPGDGDKMGRMTLAWEPSENFKASLKAQIETFANNGPLATGALVNCGGPNNTPAVMARFGQAGQAPCQLSTTVGEAEYLGNRKSFLNIDSYAITYTMNWRQSFGELTSITGLNRYDLTSFSTSDFTTYSQGVDAEIDNRNQQVSTELRYQTKFDSPVNGLAGVYYQSGAFQYVTGANLFPISVQNTVLTYLEPRWQHDETKSAFAEAQIALPQDLEVDLSGRYTDERKTAIFSQSYVSPYAPAQAAYGPGGTQESPPAVESFNFSPQATVTWKPTADIMAFGSYKTGFLSGGYNLSAITSPRTLLNSLTFQPEKVEGGEIGTKFFLFDRHVQLNADGYYYNYTGMQENVFDPVLVAYHVANAAQSIDKGIEVSGTAKLGHGFSLSGNVALNKSYYVSYIGACNPAYAAGTGLCTVRNSNGTYSENYANLPQSMAPLWAGFAQLGYMTSLDDDTTMRAAVAGHMSQSYIVGDVYKQAGWSKLDANVAVDRGQWTGALIGRNLTNVITCGQSAARPLSTAPSELRCLEDRGAEVRLEATWHY